MQLQLSSKTSQLVEDALFAFKCQLKEDDAEENQIAIDDCEEIILEIQRYYGRD